MRRLGSERLRCFLTRGIAAWAFRPARLFAEHVGQGDRAESAAGTLVPDHVLRGHMLGRGGPAAVPREKEGAAMELPLVRAAFDVWPKARIIAVRERDELIAPPDQTGEGAGGDAGDMADMAQSPDALMDGNGE